MKTDKREADIGALYHGKMLENTIMKFIFLQYLKGGNTENLPPKLIAFHISNHQRRFARYFYFDSK